MENPKATAVRYEPTTIVAQLKILRLLIVLAAYNKYGTLAAIAVASAPDPLRFHKQRDLATAGNSFSPKCG